MKKSIVIAVFVLLKLAVANVYAADALHFVIMSSADPSKEGPKYEALSAYIRAGVPSIGEIQLRVAKDYPEAAKLFNSGEADGMFSGSFVAAILIKKELAKPVARPLGVNGVSTYKAIIAAKEGTKPFGGITDFRGKRVAYSLLASSGEIFVRSLLASGVTPESVYTPVAAVSHQAALNAVINNAADYAVVKNTVFLPEKFPGLVRVGSDAEENPDNTLILNPGTYEKFGGEISRVLLGLEADKSEGADAVKKAFGCKAFIPTTAKDFSHTFSILEKAHIDAKRFDFAF